MKSKEAQARAAQKHYLANKEAVKARARKYTLEVSRPRNVAYILEYKLTHPCVDCPVDRRETDPVVLQFHHVSGDKDANIADDRVRGWSLERLISEIAKCIVLCANCHLRRHYRERLRGVAQSA